MDNRQNAKKNMYNKMLLFFTENGTVWVAFTLLVNKVAKFVSKNGVLEGYIAKQEQTTTGITTNKENKIDDLVDLVIKSSRKARVWAEDADNAEMEALFDVRKDELILNPGNIVIAKCKDIRDGLNDNITALAIVNVLAGDVTAISDAITAAEAVLGAPTAAEAAKEVATTGIEATMKDMDVILDSISDLLISEYESTNVDMVTEFKNSKKIINTGIRHNGVLATLFYEGTTDPVYDIQMKVLGTDKTGRSDVDGKVKIIKIKVGTYYLEFSGEGIVTKVVRVTIIQGKIIEITVELEKLPVVEG